MAINWIKGEKEGQITHVGSVLEFPVYKPHAYNSDYEPFVAVVWTGEKIENVMIGEVSYGSSWANADVTVDATEEIKALVAQYKREQDRLAQRSYEINREWKSATTIKNSDMIVVKGRKIKKGTIVNALYKFESRYGMCVKLSDGQLVSAENLSLMMTETMRTIINTAHAENIRLQRPEHSVWDEEKQDCIEDWN